MKRFLYLSTTCLTCAMILLLCASSCTQPLSESEGLLTFNSTSENCGYRIVSWNIQTFFDAEASGDEYSEFTGSKSDWNENLYSTRLDRLAAAIIRLDADILALEEIENEAIIQDITNRLYKDCPSRKRYPYACFAKGEGEAIGCAVLSRIPITSLLVHQTTVWGVSVPAMRPLLEVTLAGDDIIKLFVCHWKSKSGNDEDEGAYWRKKQETLLADRFLVALKGETALTDGTQNCSAVTTGSMLIAACGDFNQDISEFDIDGKRARLQHSPIADGDNFAGDISGDDSNNYIELINPWLIARQKVGSYFYQGSWERIDHFFIPECCEYENFSVENCGDWVTSDGKPYGYTLYTGEGYSDHLPISITLKRK